MGKKIKKIEVDLNIFKIMNIENREEFFLYEMLNFIFSINANSYKYIVFDKEKNFVFDLNEEKNWCILNVKNFITLYSGFIRYWDNEAQGNRIHIGFIFNLINKTNNSFIFKNSGKLINDLFIFAENNSFELKIWDDQIELLKLKRLFYKSFEIVIEKYSNHILNYAVIMRRNLEEYIKFGNKSLNDSINLLDISSKEKEEIHELRKTLNKIIHYDDADFSKDIFQKEINKKQSMMVYFKIPSLNNFQDSISLSENTLIQRDFITHFIENLNYMYDKVRKIFDKDVVVGEIHFM